MTCKEKMIEGIASLTETQSGIALSLFRAFDACDAAAAMKALNGAAAEDLEAIYACLGREGEASEMYPRLSDESRRKADNFINQILNLQRCAG